MTIIQKKICLLGDFSVGKTSMIRRFVEDKFSDDYLSTIGVKISRKRLQRDDFALNFLIWDLAGGDNFEKMGINYLRGAVGAIIVCDLTRPNTLPALDAYLQLLQSVNPQAAIVLAGNKADLEEERLISDSDLDAFCKRAAASCLLTSAKTGQNVESAFDRLADLLLNGRLRGSQ